MNENPEVSTVSVKGNGTITKMVMTRGYSGGAYNASPIIIANGKTTMSTQSGEVFTCDNIVANNVGIRAYGNLYTFIKEVTVYYIPPTIHTVTWKNWDGTELEKDTDVEEGATPAYDGETPTKAAGDGYTYTFSGWTDGTNTYGLTDTLPGVTGDVTYTATFDPELAESTFYVVGSFTEWQTDDAYTLTENAEAEGEYMLTGVELNKDDELKVVETKDPSVGFTPKWHPDNMDNYTVPADGTYDIYFRPGYDGGDDWFCNCPYLADVTPISTYTVTWKNYDGTVLETDTDVEEGTTPEYNGDTPTKAEDDENTYEFAGWTDGTNTYSLTDELPAVTTDVTYTAVFNSTGKYVAVAEMINALPEEVTVNDKDAVEAARAAYEALSDSQKALISDETLAKLEAAEEALIPELVNESYLENNITAIKIGNSVKVYGAASGGKGEYTYAVYYKQASLSKWTCSQDYSANSEVTIKPASVTDYDICVKVKDGRGTIKRKLFTVSVTKPENTSTVSKTEIALGDDLTVYCSAAGGAGEFTYAVYYKQASQSKWTCQQDYSTNSEVSIKPASATDYNICVKAKDEDGTIVKKYFTVSVKVPENTSTISDAEIALGDDLTVYCSAVGGTGEFTYAVYYKQASQSKWTCSQDYSANNKVTIKPASATDYDICVKAKDSNGNEAKKSFTVPVSVICNKSTVSPESIELGNTFTVDCSATGGSGDYKFAVYTRRTDQTSWSCQQSYSENTNLIIKPVKATDYEVCVKVKDSEGNLSKKYFNVTVTE